MKRYKFDQEGNLVEATQEDELNEEEQKANTSKLNQFIRTVPGIATDLITETVDLGRLLADVKLQTSPLGRSPLVQKAKEETYTKQDEAIKTVYETVLGKENIEMVQRGERQVPAVKEPEGLGKELTRDIGGLAAAIYGAGKIKWVKDIKKRPITQAVVSGEVGSQVGFNPYEEGLIPEALGSLISDDNEALSDLKEYLEGDRQENSQLHNRILMLGDGLVAAGVFVGGGKMLGAAGRKTGATPYLKNKGDITLTKLKEGREAFGTFLKDIKEGGQETVDNFLSNLNESVQINKAQKDLALKHREKDIIEGVVSKEAVGDVDALKPGFISKYVSDTNLMFTANPILRNMESIRRRILTTKGNRTVQLYEKYLKSENLKEKWNDTITNVAFNLEMAMEDVLKTTSKFKNKDNLNEQISYVLFTDFRSPTTVTASGGIRVGRTQKTTFKKELNKLPEELREPIKAARKLQDDLTEQMIDTGTLTEAQKKIYREQMGFYVRRSYKLFEDPNYIPTRSVKKEASDFLTEQYRINEPALTDQEILVKVNADINKILDVKKGTDFAGSKDTFDKIRKEILKGKEDIASPIRKLMGEINDPTQSIIHSTIKLGNYVENVKFYNEAFEGGAGIYFRKDAEGLFAEVIPEGYGKLSGRFTTPELKKYFSNHQSISQKVLAGQNTASAIYRNLAVLKGVSQAAKTVWSHTTHVKNVAGGVQMSLANGVNVFDLNQTKDIVKILRARTRNNKELQGLHEELSGLGLLNKGVVARDLKGLAKDLEAIKTKNLADYPANLAKKFLDKTGISKHAEKWQNAYIAEDDFFKINMYFQEKKNLEKINNMYSKESGLKLTEQEIKEQSARMVRDVLPNYDLVPEMLQELRRTPFFGRFFSFMAESVRISGNSIYNGIQEVAKGRRLIKQGEKQAGNEFVKRGTLRLGAFTAVAGGGAKAVESTSKAVTGLTTDVVDAIKDLVLPDYMQNSNVVLSIAPDGSPVVANLSSWDAFDFPKKPFQVLINKYINEDTIDEDGLIGDILTTTFTETVSPFLGESIIQEQLSNYVLRNGKTLDGKAMKNPFNRLSRFNDKGSYAANMFDGENLTILAANMLESITPGSITRGQDLYKTLTNKHGKTPYNQDEYEAQAFLKFVTGWGMQPINPEYIQKMYEFKSSDLMRSKQNSQRAITSSIGQELNPDTFTNEYLKRNQEHYKSYIKFYKNTESLKKLGANPFTALDNTNLSTKDKISLLTGRHYEPIGLSDNLKLKMLEASPSFEVFEQTYQDILAIDRKMSRLPVYASPLYYKKEKQKVKEIKEELRENYKTGGIVPNVQEDPADRVDPFTGEPYSEQMDRIGLSKGGNIDELLAKKIFNVDAKWQRKHEAETAALVNSKIDEGVFPERGRVPINPSTGNVEGRIPDEEIFNKINHQRLAYKMGDSFTKKTGLQLREGLSLIKNTINRVSGDYSKETFLRENKDAKVDFLNNRVGFDLKNQGLTQEEAENQIVKNTIEEFNLGK